jgi:SAM-dependent methyltransferase
MWTRTVEPEVIARARRGDWSVVLTPVKPVPPEWFGDVKNKDILGLASGGGQQMPVLAAAGARVTCLDNSAGQLRQDELVAEREGLRIRLEKGDAADLSRFADGSFDLIFHPCSNCFMPDLEPIWRECFRVLRPGGALLSGFANPAIFIFDRYAQEGDGTLTVRHSIPCSDTDSLEESELAEMLEKNEPLEYSHTLTSQIGGQTAQGFHVVGLYEDYWHSERPIDAYMPSFIATRAVKP